jgi:hypothetical protein
MEAQKSTQEKVQELVNILQAHEMRIEYNFNAMLQLSMLVEYLYEKLAEQKIEINMEGFQDFQKKRLEEIDESYKEMNENPELKAKVTETISEMQKEIQERIKL